MDRHFTSLTLITCVLLACGAARAGWLKQIEITSDPLKDGQKDYTVRILPGKTHQCDKIVFECVYCQQLPWEDARGKAYIKNHEPVSFTYRRLDVGLVNDLDTFVSFRVPIGLDKPIAAYGDKVFNKDVPVTISRMIITATAAGETLWSYELKGEGVHDLTSGGTE
jgi:hypothetical protein